MDEKETTKKEMRKIEEDLEDLEMYIREFSSFLPLAVCTVNPPKIIIDVNQAFQALTGFGFLNIISEPLENIFLEKKEIDNLLEKAREGKTPVTKELTLISKEKKMIPVEISISTREDEAGKFIGYFLALSNISEVKKSREELEKKVEERTEELEKSRIALMNMLEDIDEARGGAEEEKNKTLAIINNFTDGLLVFDKENNLSLANPQTEIFFDIRARDIIGRSILDLTTFPTIAPIASMVGKEMRGLFRKEIPVKENLILEISTIPIMSQEEKLGTLIILHDVTRERMIEKMKTEFVSISAHQLRTPLSAIKWTLRMLLDGDLGEISSEQRNFLEKTYKSNERMITLINDLLDVTRIEEGRYLYKPVLADFELIVQFVVNSYKEEFEKKKIDFEFQRPEKKLPQVMVDVEKLRLAIQNLLDNALRYTHQGGKVTVSLRYVKKEIEVAVKDTGVGIPEDQQERIFSKFFRGANVLRLETEGSGLGLFITKNIIEAHGGRIWFESEEGKGTTFYFILPIKEEFGEFLKEF